MTVTEQVQPPECPLCGRREWTRPRAGAPYHRCRSCALWYNGRSQSREEEERLYDHCASVPVQDQEAIAVGYWRQLQQLAADRGLTPLKSVLDVGCGSGQFLLQARSGGAVVAGLELDPAQVAACRERGIPVHSGSLFDLGAPPGPWQAITLWDVLDHLDEPVEALRILIRELEPGGIVVARGRNGAVHVPLKVARVACPSVFGRLPDLSVVHRWALSPTAWAGLFERAGLENVRLLAGVPTVGDRYRMMGAAPVGAFMKRALRDASVTLSRCTNGKCYVFPSVLLVGRKPL